MSAKSVIEIREPSESDRQIVREFLSAGPLVGRSILLFSEMRWVLEGRKDDEQHLRALPDYCYNIFEAFRVTFFKNFPPITDIIFIKDNAGIAEAKTIEAAKKVIQIDFKNLGRTIGVGMRCLRFAEKEAVMGVDGEPLENLPPQDVQKIFAFAFGKKWMDENAAKLASESPDRILSQMLNEFIRPWTEKLAPAAGTLRDIAYQWGSAALAELHEGIAEGLNGFLSADNQFVGETPRSSTYVMLLLAWPEIKAMQEARPRKNLRHLHAWLLPFMRVGMMPYLDIDQLRDVCAPPSQRGIGLGLRPLKSSRASAD